MEEDWDRLNHAIDRRFQIEDAFIQAMAQEFQRIQQELNECIARYPNDRQLARVREDVEQLGEQSRAIVPYKSRDIVVRNSTPTLPFIYPPHRRRHPVNTYSASANPRGGKRTRRR